MFFLDSKIINTLGFTDDSDTMYFIINYIQGLLQESYDIIQKEDTIKLARDLEELLRKGREWSANFQKIKRFFA